MRAGLVAAAALWVAGIALVILSVLEGRAAVWLFLIIPVISGSSPEFVAGVGLMVAGFVALMFAFADGTPEPPISTAPSPGAATTPTSGGGGGLVLIGPVPIVFGSWKGVSRRTRWWLALVGGVLLIVVLLVGVWLLR